MIDEITVGIDTGYSNSKILYYLARQQIIKYMVMRSEYIDLPPQSASNLPKRATGRPEDNAWVRFTAKGDCHLLGQLAKSKSTLIDFKSEKTNSLTPRILGTIGSICLKENFSNNLKIKLIVLLPWGEYPRTEIAQVKLKKEVQKSLSNFYFQEKRISVKVVQFDLIPEAGGLALLDKQRSNYYRNHNCLYLMIGDKNSSALFFRNSTLSPDESTTTNLGFNDLADKFIQHTSGISKELLYQAIKTTQTSDTKLDWQALNDHLKRSNPRNEMTNKFLQQKWLLACDEYWRILSKHLLGVLPPLSVINCITRCGGTSALLLPQISAFFGNTPMYLPYQFQTLVRALRMNNQEALEFYQQNFPFRFADIWAALLTATKLHATYLPEAK